MEMSSLDPEHSNEEVYCFNFGHTSGDNFGDANDGEKWTEDGTTCDQEAVGELRARPS